MASRLFRHGEGYTECVADEIDSALEAEGGSLEKDKEARLCVLRFLCYVGVDCGAAEYVFLDVGSCVFFML